MDDPLPLPKRIPNPTDEQLMLLTAMGFAINYTNYTKRDKYVEYDLPKDWKIIDDSSSKHTPMFSIVDEKQLERVKIYCVLASRLQRLFENDHLEGSSTIHLYKKNGR